MLLLLLLLLCYYYTTATTTTAATTLLLVLLLYYYCTINTIYYYCCCCTTTTTTTTVGQPRQNVFDTYILQKRTHSAFPFIAHQCWDCFHCQAMRVSAENSYTHESAGEKDAVCRGGPHSRPRSQTMLYLLQGTTRSENVKTVLAIPIHTQTILTVRDRIVLSSSSSSNNSTRNTILDLGHLHHLHHLDPNQLF